MRLAFVNPPKIDGGLVVEAEDCCLGASKQHYLPAMLLACASEAKRAGHQAAFVDLAIDATLPFAPEAIVYPLAFPWHKSVYRAMLQAFPDVPHLVIAMPPGYAAYYAARFKPQPFAVLYSEPEYVMSTLPLDPLDLESWRAIASGIAYGETVTARLPTCLHRLHSVDFGLVPSRYWRHYSSIIYQVSRGCPYRCRFCVWGSSTVTDRTFRMRPATQVADDIRALRALSKRQTPLYLLAAQLTTNPRWIDEFSASMAEAPYPFESNVNLLEATPEKIGALRRAGMKTCAAGLEALTDCTLDLLKKPHTWAWALDGMAIMEQSGVPYKLHVVVGYGETAEDVKQATANLKAMHAVGTRKPLINMTPIIFYAGTGFAADPPLPVRYSQRMEGCQIWAGTPEDAWVEFALTLSKLGYTNRNSFRRFEPGMIARLKKAATVK